MFGWLLKNIQLISNSSCQVNGIWPPANLSALMTGAERLEPTPQIYFRSYLFWFACSWFLFIGEGQAIFSKAFQFPNWNTYFHSFLTKLHTIAPFPLAITGFLRIFISCAFIRNPDKCLTDLSSERKNCAKKRERQHFHRTIKGGKNWCVNQRERGSCNMLWLRANESSHDISKYRPRIWKIRITSFGKSYLREWQCTSLVVNPPLMHTFPLSMFTLANTTSGNSMANSYEKMIINSTIDKKK